MADLKPYLDARIANIPENDLKDLLREQVDFMYKAVAQTFDVEKVTFLLKNTHQALTTTYKSWHWHAVVRMFERGLDEHYGPFTRITWKLVAVWMRKADADIKATRRNVEQQQEIVEYKENSSDGIDKQAWMKYCMSISSTSGWISFDEFMNLKSEKKDRIYEKVKALDSTTF